MALAVTALLPELDRRAAAGDQACELAAAALRQTPSPPDAPLPAIPPPPDPISASMDRMVALLRQQQEQIAALHKLIEAML